MRASPVLERLFKIFCTFVCNIFFLPTNEIFPGKIAGKYNMENLKQATGEINHKYMAPKIC